MSCQYVSLELNLGETMPGLNLRGDITNNFLVGSDENDTLVGRRGLDTVVGLNGDDLIWGNDDNDRLFGNAGKDSLYGGKNHDTLEGGKDDDQLLGNQGNDVILGNEGNDVVLGGGGSDLVFGGVGDDSLFGNSGNDVLFGGQGNDAIYGGKGNDHIEGDKGDDTIYGDVGADTITGGDGRDVIVLEESSRVALDTITDFQPSEDAVRLPDGTTFEELVFEPDDAGGTVVRDGRGKALLVLPGVSSTTLTPQNFQSSNTQSTPDSGAPQPPATETPQENEDTPDIPVTESDPQPEPETPVDNTEPEPPAENPEPETPPTNNTPNPVPNTPPPADPPPNPVPENQPPIAIDDIATTEFNTAIEIFVLNNDTDPDGDALTVTVDENSAINGTVTTDGTTVTYTPNVNFTGIDRVTYTVSDGTDSDTGSIEITVIPSEIRWIGGDPSDPTNWSNPNNWEFGIVPTENQDVLIPASAIHQPILSKRSDVKSLVVEEGASLDVDGSILDVLGNMQIDGSIFGDSYGGLRIYGHGVHPQTYEATLQNTLPNLSIYTPVEAPSIQIVGTTTIDGDLSLQTSGYEWSGKPVLDLNGYEVTVLGHVEAGEAGNLVMDDPDDVLNVESFSMYMSDEPSHRQLTAGVLNVFGSPNTNEYEIDLQASGTHTVVLKGSRSKSLQGRFDTSYPIEDQQYFQNLEIDNAYGVHLFDVIINGLLTLTNGVVGGWRVYLGSGLVNLTDPDPERARDAWDVTETILLGGNPVLPERLRTHMEIIGNTTFNSSFTLEGSLVVPSSFEDLETHATVRLGGNEVSVENFIAHGNAGIVMDNPNDVLVVEGEFLLENLEASQLNAGVLKLRDRQVFYNDNLDPLSFEASGTHTVVFEGGLQQVRELENPGSNPGQSHFQNIEIDHSGTITFEGETYINGDVTITRGRVESEFGYPSPFYPASGITIGGNLIDNTGSDYVWEAEVTTFTSPNPQLPRRLKTTAKFPNKTTLSNYFDLDGKAIVEAGGDLTIENSVDIAHGLTVFLSNGFDGIQGSGSIRFYSAGVLYVGDLDTTATIPEFQSNPVFYWPEQTPDIPLESLYITAHEGSEGHHGGILDARYTDTDLEIVTRNGTITLGNFNAPDALATPGIVRLSSDGGDSDASLLSRNDAGELTGTGGSDRIIGKAEAQIIDGGNGRDIISGGAGADILTGGYSADIFAYDNPSEGGDTITDFSSGQEEKIQFSSENFGNPTIEFNTIAASTGQATVYATPLSGGTQQVMFDADGNGAAQPVHLATLTNLSVPLEDGDISGYGAYPL